MAQLRNILGAGLASLLGLSMPSYAQTPEDTGIDRSEFTASQARKEVLDRAVHVNYDNWQREVVQYDGAAIVLFSTSCSQNDITRNMDVVYLGLIDRFEDTKVKNLPLKFGFYDACGKSKADLLEGNTDSIQTNMYLDGKLLDVKKGGPINEQGVKALTNDMSYWINYDLLGITEPGEENIVLLYRGDLKWKEYPRSVLRE